MKQKNRKKCACHLYFQKRVRRRQLSSYESQDEAQPQDEKTFRVEVLSVTLNSAIVSPESSSALLSSFMIACGYLYDIKKTTALSSDDITILCLHLEGALRNNDSISTDFKGTDLVRPRHSSSG
jgi:hypothetical protein